jgi:EF hand
MRSLRVAIYIAVLASSVPAEVSAWAQQAPSADVMIRKQDHNNDGRISRKEWRGPSANFDRIDRNGDGYLSRSELQGRGQAGSAYGASRSNGGSEAEI